jgi:hypothetical protein
VNIREYDRLKLEAEAGYRRTLEAIETVWKLSGGAAPQNGASSQQSTVGKGALQQAVKATFQFLPPSFTLRDVETHIRAMNPALAAKIKRPSLSSVLKRMADDNQIVRMTTGSGKRASTYRRAG